jgi:hypothetical protein
MTRDPVATPCARRWDFGENGDPPKHNYEADVTAVAN